MKKIFLVTALALATALANGQKFGGLLDKAKQKAEDKVNSKLEKKADDTVDGKQAEESREGNNSAASASGSTAASSAKVYSKFDFVPGEKVVVIEDFMQDAVGEFPDKWNTNTSGEVVTIEGKQDHWLMINKAGVFMPEFIDTLPDNFTFEFDLLCDKPGKVWSLYTSLVALSDRSHPEQWQSADNRFTFTVAAYPDNNSSSLIERRKNGVGESSSSTTTKKFSDGTKPVHVAMWRQKERVRIYFDEEKVWDLPKAVLNNVAYNALVYWLQAESQEGNYFISNLRLAVGAPDTRNKLLTEGKWVTHGILFDVNSANIKPESYGTLKEIARELNENADLKVKIVGHTDADGKDADNLDLSKRRAASVKAALAKEFGIDESKMETDGKGESEPIDKNDTPAGKANNRRVEFIKI